MPTPTPNAHVYANDGAGGPVDYATVVATVAGTIWTGPALAAGADVIYAVRLYDPGTGFEERNTDARIRVRLDGALALIPDTPDPPAHLGATADSASSVRLTWSFNPAAVPASGFGLWATAGTVPNTTGPPNATVAWIKGDVAYTGRITGLAASTAYAVAVRALGAAGYGPESNPALVTTAAAGGPAAVDALAGSATPLG
jgi:hypothetical protein